MHFVNNFWTIFPEDNAEKIVWSFYRRISGALSEQLPGLIHEDLKMSLMEILNIISAESMYDFVCMICIVMQENGIYSHWLWCNVTTSAWACHVVRFLLIDIKICIWWFDFQTLVADRWRRLNYSSPRCGPGNTTSLSSPQKDWYFAYSFVPQKCRQYVKGSLFNFQFFNCLSFSDNVYYSTKVELLTHLTLRYICVSCDK